MTDQPPRGTGDYERYFRDSKPTGQPSPPADELSAYKDLFREDRASNPQNRSVRQTPTSGPQQPSRAATPTAVPPAQPPARLPQPRRKRPLWKRILRWIALILAILLGYVAFLLVYLVANINKIDAMPPDQIGNTSGAVTLIVGSDERVNDPSIGSRTDTIMLMVDPLFGAPTLISIPRDSWVAIPGHGNGKVNASYSIGGPQLLIETVEQATGLHVDHYMEIGFGGVVDLTNAVGGVELCIDFDVDDPNSGLKMSAGCSVLQGDQALAFVRMRYSDPKGDLGRIERQQQWIESFVKTVLQPKILLNPFKMTDVVKAGAQAVTVDQDTGPINLARFGWAMLQVGRGKGQVTTVPIADQAGWRQGQSVVLWDDAAAQQLFQSLGAD